MRAAISTDRNTNGSDKALIASLERAMPDPLRASDVSARMDLLDPVEQIRGRNPQGAGEPHDRRQTRLSLGPFEQADLGPVKVAGKAKRLLGQPCFQTARLQVLGEPLPGFHRIDARPAQTKGLQTKHLGTS